jgi:hypothetical protein
MTQPGESTFFVTSAAEWESVRRDLLADNPMDVRDVLRAYGVEGQVTFGMEPTDVSWGGSLLDLADWLAGWRASLPADSVFQPLEQANAVRALVTDEYITFSSGGASGTLPRRLCLSMIDRWLIAIAREIQQNAPAVLDNPGFAWAKRLVGAGE